MSKLCRISVIGLQFLLLTQITHSFVLLTANVEDVKKIARKFVSDSLAERITDFIAKATETLVEEQNNSEENKAQESSQVSAENRMYNVEKAINERLDDVIKTKDGTTVTPKSLNTKKEKDKEVVDTTVTRNKHRKAAPKPLHGRSRYIEPEERAKPTEKTSTKINEKKNIESSTPSEPKDKRINNNKKRFKLLSAFDYNTTAATTGIPTLTEKVKIDKKTEKTSDKKPSDNPKRSMGGEISSGTESDHYDTDEYVYDIAKNKNSERTVSENDQYDNSKNKNPEKSANNYDQYDIEINKITETEGSSSPISEKDDYVNEIENIIPIHEKVATRGSLVKERELNEDKWWEQELTTRLQSDADVQAEGKSWF